MIKQLLFACTATTLILVSATSCRNKNRNNNATDTLGYEIKSLTTSFNNCNIDSPDCSHITYTFPFFNTSGTTADSLNAYIKFMLGEKTGGNTLQKTQNNFMADYSTYLKDTDTPQVWYSQTNIDVAYQHNKVVSLIIEMDDYTGGAHGMISTIYQVFDKTNNKVLMQTSLIKKDKAQDLLTIAEKSFRKNAELSDTTDLEKAGYWFKDNSFYLTENYCVTSDGITWLYNPYEIAPYSQGTIELFLTKEELAPYINETYKDIWD